MHDTYVEWVERTQKLNGVRYTYTGLLEKAVSATNKHVYVYVTADEWRHFYFDRGGGCGLRGLNLLPSTTHLNTSACSWYNYRAKSRYVEACGWGDNPETDVPCADTMVPCDADRTTMSREYVYFVRVEEELMRVIDMDPPPLNDSAWQNVKDKMKLKDTYHSTQPAWDSTYTNGGTGLLARVFAWDASALEEDSSKRLVKPQFWTTATPFYEERLVGSTDRDGFKHADDWSRILGLTSEQSSAMLVELSGKLVVPGSGPVKFTFKCHSGCNVYLDGASLTEGPVLDGSQNVKGMQMTAGVYDWRIEFVKRPSDGSDPTLSFIVRNSTTGVETYHVETFGPGVRSFRVRVKVERGIDGSTAAAHPEGAVVTSPIYKGSSSNTCSAGHPDGGATKLIYYAEKTEEGMSSWGEVLAANMQDSPGIDGWYYDSSGFSLPSFNMGDTKGRGARPWNFDTNAPLTDDENFLAYEVQYSTMQKVAHEVTGRYPIFVANGNGPRYNDTVFDSFLFPGGIIPAGIFGHTEAGFKRYGNLLSSARDVLVLVDISEIRTTQNLGDKWLQGMKSNLYQFQRNLGVSMQCKSTGHKMFPNEQAFTYAQAALMVKISEFCWGGYLLSKVAGNHTPQIEWDLSWFSGIFDWHKDGVHRRDDTFASDYETPAFFRYPLGDPVETIHHADWPEISYRVAPHTFARRFENGIVLVNPYDDTGEDEEDIEHNEGVGNMTDATGVNDDNITLSDKMIDAGTGLVLDHLTVKEGTSRFLLSRKKLRHGNDAILNGDKQYVPAYRSMGLNDHGEELG